MTQIFEAQVEVLVACDYPDIKANVLADAIRLRSDMRLLREQVVPLADVDSIMASLSDAHTYALIAVGDPTITTAFGRRCLERHPNIAVLYLDVVGDAVRIELRNPTLESILSTTRSLVKHIRGGQAERVARVRVTTTTHAPALMAAQSGAVPGLYQATVDWLNRTWINAVSRVTEDSGDVPGLSLTRTSLLSALRTPIDDSVTGLDIDPALRDALETHAGNDEPLAIAYQSLALSQLDYCLLALALSPELDIRFQRSIGFLLDDLSRRAATLTLLSNLLGPNAHIRAGLAASGKLTHWGIFDMPCGRFPCADEPLRVDPHLTQWLLGDPEACWADPRVRRVVRTQRWPGAATLSHARYRTPIDVATNAIDAASTGLWHLFDGNDAAMTRAVLEHNAQMRGTALIRVDADRLAGLDILEVEETAIRLARMTRLLGDLLVIDATECTTAQEFSALRMLIETLESRRCSATVLCAQPMRVATLIVGAPMRIVDRDSLALPDRSALFAAAALGADVHVSTADAERIAGQFPLQIDVLDHATRITASHDDHAGGRGRTIRDFASACKALATGRMSQLADHIDPAFELDNLVLPEDRVNQIRELVNHVRYASRVLDDWKFGAKLPYGRGVAALFSGPSGTGKTMAAMVIARELGVELLHIDLSRVVSKYIGDTEKNIDRVFVDAQRSGSVLLIDEADALFGKRSEVRDAHDRYANIEIAFLLQRMEAYDGLAILTTNMRQNLDAAFVRRLRFIIDFPKPDAAARERIWRFCLPADCHALDDADFRHLGRKIDLTGGHIRQIAMRAAFVAATGNSLITTDHIMLATRAEFDKLGMSPIGVFERQLERAA
jgi:AAA+ superfamily predicted ATPase